MVATLRERARHSRRARRARRVLSRRPDPASTRRRTAKFLKPEIAAAARRARRATRATSETGTQLDPGGLRASHGRAQPRRSARSRSPCALPSPAARRARGSSRCSRCSAASAASRDCVTRRIGGGRRSVDCATPFQLLNREYAPDVGLDRPVLRSRPTGRTPDSGSGCWRFESSLLSPFHQAD